MRYFASLLVLSLALCATLRAQPTTAYHTTLFDKLRPESSQYFSSLTGYVAPDGREYALLGGSSGTHIIDVTVKPVREVAFIAGPESRWREMKTYLSYAYVVTEGGGGLQIIDLSKLPASASLVRSDASRFDQAHTITQEGTYLYINGTYGEGIDGGTLILDLEPDPVHPTVAGVFSTRYVHDVTVRNDTMYAAEINDGKLDIIYLGADRANPTFVADIRYPGAGTHNADLSADGRYIFTTDEVNTTPKTLKVWDRSDIENISKVADFTPVPGEVIHNVRVKGNHAYVSWYSAGTRILDISDPRNPFEVGYYDTYPGTSSATIGNWEVYPYLPSGKILSSDMVNGLFVFTFDGATPGSARGSVVDSVTGAPIPYARLFVPELGRTVVANANGEFTYAGATDTLSFIATADNYIDATGQLRVVVGGGEAQTIRLAPIPTVPLELSVIDDETSLGLTGFTYRIYESRRERRSTSGTETLTLRKDNSFTIEIGAWGYRPERIHVVANEAMQRVVRLRPGYFDNAELDLGWIFSAPTDNAGAGFWERGVPEPTMTTGGTPRLIQPGFNHSAPPADHAFVTGREGYNTIGTNDVDGGVTTLVSPTFDAARYDDPYLVFWLWYSNDGNASADDDTLAILISENDAGSWRTIGSDTTSTTGWKRVVIRLRDHVTPTSQMRFAIAASDNGRESIVEALMDDWAVVEQEEAGVMEHRSIVTSAMITPAPTAGSATLRVSMKSAVSTARFEVYDAHGSTVLRKEVEHLGAGDNALSIDLTSLGSGLYRWRLVGDGIDVDGPVIVVR